MRSFYVRICVYAIEKCSPNLITSEVYEIFFSTSLAYVRFLNEKFKF
jgi:hypothetical protein